MIQFLLIIPLILVIQSSSAQKWDMTYGTTNSDEGFSDVVECYDKGYLISGGQEIPLYCEWLIKTDINGIQLWDKKIYHNEYHMNSGPVEQNSSGEIAIAGTIFFDNENWPYIIKLDECGNKQWCRIYIEDESEWGVFEDVILLENGDVIALAHMSNQYYYPDNIFLYYIDSSGNLLWRESYASKDEYPDILLPHGKKLYKLNNGYMIAGQCYYPSPQGYMRPLFIRLEDDFEETWILPFGVSSSLIAYGINVLQMNDSTYMGLGTTGDETRLMFFNDEGIEV